MRPRPDESQIRRIGGALAAARRGATLVAPSIDLRRIASSEDALTVQAEATAALDGPPIGYAIAASSEATARLLGCDGPTFGPILPQDRLRSGESLSVRPSMLGVGAQLSFVFGLSYVPGRTPGCREPADAIASCRVALQVLMRRVPHSAPLNDWTATADFGLSGAYVEGPRVEDWRERLDPRQAVTLLIDGHVNARGHLHDTMGHPLAAVTWLVERLAREGRYVEAGDIVSVGSCTGLVQMSPNRTVRGDFGELGSVELRLT